MAQKASLEYRAGWKTNTQPTHREIMGKHGAERCTTGFTWGKVGSDYLSYALSAFSYCPMRKW
eukprot:1193780-Prorocentrum_minimum.AAC.3